MYVELSEHLFTDERLVSYEDVAIDGTLSRHGPAIATAKYDLASVEFLLSYQKGMFSSSYGSYQEYLNYFIASGLLLNDINPAYLPYQIMKYKLNIIHQDLKQIILDK